MTESWLAQLRARHADIERRLEEAGAQAEREASKREIIAYLAMTGSEEATEYMLELLDD